MSERCLLCDKRATDNAHFPRAIGMGRNRKKVKAATIPLCHGCHMEVHAAMPQTMEQLIRLAPMYFVATGQDEALEDFQVWLARRRYVKGEDPCS